MNESFVCQVASTAIREGTFDVLWQGLDKNMRDVLLVALEYRAEHLLDQSDQHGHDALKAKIQELQSRDA